jgi:hypothetical protein
MTDTYRALCAELLRAWQFGDDIAGPMNRARAELAKPEPMPPTAWMYQGEPDFDGNHWRENWKITLDEKLARYMSGKKEPIPLWCRPTPQPEPVAPTDEEILAMRSWSCHAPTFDSDLVDFGRRCYNLGRYGTPANALPTPEAHDLHS